MCVGRCVPVLFAVHRLILPIDVIVNTIDHLKIVMHTCLCVLHESQSNLLLKSAICWSLLH